MHDRHNLIYAKDTCRYCQLHSELNLKKISHYAAGTNSLQLIALYNMLKGGTLHFSSIVESALVLASFFVVINDALKDFLIQNSYCAGIHHVEHQFQTQKWIKLNLSPYLYFSKNFEQFRTFKMH